MQLNDVADAMTTLMIVIAILVLLFLVVFFATKKYDDAKRQSDAARDDIRELRKKRLTLIDQSLQMFSQDNPHAEGLKKLADIYRGIDSEKKEVAWEEKYVIVMKKFMAYAKKELPANMQNAWKMSNTAINENEQLLDGAREAYVACQETMKSFDKAPQCYAIKIGNKIMGMMKRHADEKAEQQAQKSAENAGVSSNATTASQVSSQTSSQISQNSPATPIASTATASSPQTPKTTSLSGGIKNKIADAMRAAASQIQSGSDQDIPDEIHTR